MARPTRAVDPYDLRDDPELSELLDALQRMWRLDIRTHVPASVVTFDAAQQTARVRVDILPVVQVTTLEQLAEVSPKAVIVRGTPPNAEAVLQPLELSNIRVQIDGTDTNYTSYPILPGTTGYLHVADRSIKAWLTTGIPTEPVLALTHVLQDSVFVPGLRPSTRPIAQPIDLTATVLEGPQIKIGRLAVEHIVKAESLVTQLIAAVSAAATGSMDGGATFKTNLIVQLQVIQAAISTISSTKASVE